MKKILLLGLISFLGANYETASYGIIKGDNVRIRSDKNLSSKVVGVLNRNDKVIIIGDSEKEFEIDGQSYLWYNISYKGKTGWVYGKFLNILPTEPRENKYYIKLLGDNIKGVFTKKDDGYFSVINPNNVDFKKEYYLILNEPGYLYLLAYISQQFCVDTIKEVYQYNGDNLKCILTGVDGFKIHKNYIFSIERNLHSNDSIDSIEVFDMNKPIKDKITSSYDCLFEKVYEINNSREADTIMYFDQDTLTISFYMEKLNMNVSVLKFKNGVFQP